MPEGWSPCTITCVLEREIRGSRSRGGRLGSRMFFLLQQKIRPPKVGGTFNKKIIVLYFE